MKSYEINEERKYYNFGGKIPPIEQEKPPANVPKAGPHTHPKLITDTTMRDGAQDPCFAILPNETKLKYFDLLHELDNGTGIIDSVEVFIYQKRDLWVLEKLLEREYDFPHVSTWTRATPKDIHQLVQVSQGRITETGVLASSSDHHIFDRLEFRSKQEAIDRYLTPILTACENNIIPRVHLEDATKADIHGWVLPFMSRVLDETGGKARFRVCDTLGIGVPDPYASLPMGIPRLISTLSGAFKAELEFHGHNDFGYATANSMAAFRYGCKRVNTAFAGLGERTGNAALEQVLVNYVREYGNPGLKLEVLTEIADLIRAEVIVFPEKQPIIGKNIFATQAGLHQTGIQRQDKASGGLIYLPFDPGVIGSQPVELNLIGAVSGMDGIASVLNHYEETNGGQNKRYTNISKLIKRIYDSIHNAYDGEYDQAEDRYAEYRSTFFEVEELVRMSKELQGEKPENL